jgi:uncharacterized membrane protein YphA (DoxX/SURF4 family)
MYAGLAGCLIALLVATWQQRWRARVFFLLALRLAIGWHFLFEGMYKIHSHAVGESAYNRVFTSEPYFKVAPGPFGEEMRRRTDDPAPVIAARATPAAEVTPETFAALSAAEQAARCPEVVAKELDAVSAQAEETARKAAEKNLADARKAVEAAKDPAAKAKAEAAVADAQKAADAVAVKTTAEALVTAAKATYARWVYGVDGRDTKVKFVNNSNPPLSAPQRLRHIESLRRAVADAEATADAGLGNGYGIEQKRAAELRGELIAAESGLAADALAFSAELKKALAGSDFKEEKPAEKAIVRMDKLTMWVLTAVGACLLMGLFTRPAALVAAGFLVLTYLTHPPFPWYPLPPGTEGNPVFVNKNLIEAIALLVICCYPTGKWLGLDALLYRLIGRR